MNIDLIKDHLKDYAKDLRINIETVLSFEGAPGLSQDQRYGVFLAAAYTTKIPSLIKIAEELTQGELSAEEREGVKSAVSIMGMNNVYYRTLHLMEGQEDIKRLPAKLRMTIIGSPKIDKSNFELYCLASSVVNACGMCINAHIEELKKCNVSFEGIQSVIRVSAVTHSVAQALTIG